ncbi:MAG TPA: alpha/beta fold hydrolase [Gemmatimonadota bacterium]|nr:alpha/beta fold hydrolase [Gemmatimonadota bacterium]
MSGVALALLAVVLLVGGGLVGLWLLFGWVGAWRLNRSYALYPDVSFSFTPWELGVKHEEVEFRTADGISLRGWLLPRPETARTVVSLHGYRGHMAQLLGISTLLWRAGFNVLLFDFRGRGRSGAAPISMGLWERGDLAAALDLVSRRIAGARIGLLGYSMGAVVAAYGGGDPRVRALVLDSCFTSLTEVLERMAGQEAHRYLRGWVDGRAFLPAMEWWHRRRGKPAFAEAAPIQVMKSLASKPVLVIQGERDATVPAEHGERLAAAADAELWLVPGAHHCGAYFVDRPAYAERVTDFFRRHLVETGTAEAVEGGR